ncbi:chitinase [Mycetohabitans rhizoxinica]|uniref:Chitinase n=2 Tax=Mycetohabitans rhizoxinica TaxID=412963 RepID=A0ABZ2PWT7_9BURK
MKKHLLKAIALSAMSVGLYGHAFGEGVYAPYVDMTAWPTPSLDEVGVRQGIQQFTMAFVLSGGNQCVPSWGGVQPIGRGQTSDLLTSIAKSINNYRAKGGEVSISFGGQAGMPLMQACSSASALAAAYQTVIDTYSLTHIDFDIEGAAQTDSAALTRNFQAVRQLQHTMRTNGKALHVTLTLPVMPSGLTADGLRVLDAALDNGVTLDTVNIMAMDYGNGTADMGAAAKRAATSVYAQLDAAYKAAGSPKTDAQLWQMIGVTPMIGKNDVQGETFSLADAKALLDKARSDGIGLLSNWSIGRDKACASNSGGASPSCSGVSQQPYAFTQVFRQLGGHWGTGVTQDSSYGGGSHGGKPTPGAQWSSSQIYTAGMTVKYHGVTYRAKWWTQGDVPGQSEVWAKV